MTYTRSPIQSRNVGDVNLHSVQRDMQNIEYPLRSVPCSSIPSMVCHSSSSQWLSMYFLPHFERDAHTQDARHSDPPVEPSNHCNMNPFASSPSFDGFGDRQQNGTMFCPLIGSSASDPNREFPPNERTIDSQPPRKRRRVESLAHDFDAEVGERGNPEPEQSHSNSHCNTSNVRNSTTQQPAVPVFNSTANNAGVPLQQNGEVESRDTTTGYSNDPNDYPLSLLPPRIRRSGVKCDRKDQREKSMNYHQKKRKIKNRAQFVHQCGDCGKMCQSESKLNAHKRTHSGKKPFSCKYCGKNFSDSSNRNRHQLIHTVSLSLFSLLRFANICDDLNMLVSQPTFRERNRIDAAIVPNDSATETV